jgi:putative FmdB family regulatory protein
VPLYDYDCAACGRRFEVIHGVHADPPAACPLCGGGPVRKAITAASVHYRGTGWAKKERRAAIKSGPSSKGDDGSTDSDSSGADKAAADKAAVSSSDGEASAAVPSASGKAESSTATSTATASGNGTSSKPPARTSD